MTDVLIVDTGMGNLDSVARAVSLCGGNPRVSSEPRALGAAQGIILPGVGAFADGMRSLSERELRQPLCDRARDGVPLLGICLGMQLLAESGEEGQGGEGLGLIPGRVVRLEPRNGERVPHVGWNEVDLRGESPLFADIASGKDFYFVHSYHLVDSPAPNVLARTPYCGGMVSAVGAGRIYGVQFHPEKSRPVGFQLLRNFLGLCRC